MDSEIDKMIIFEFISDFEKLTFWIINTSEGKNIVTADLVAAMQSVKFSVLGRMY
jgi:D-3-phosphoglycerate dehydrogenase